MAERSTSTSTFASIPRDAARRSYWAVAAFVVTGAAAFLLENAVYRALALLIGLPFAVGLLVQELQRRRRAQLLCGREPVEVHLLVQAMIAHRWMPPQPAREAWLELAERFDVDALRIRHDDVLADVADVDALQSELVFVCRSGGAPPERLEIVADAIELAIALKRALP